MKIEFEIDEEMVIKGLANKVRDLRQIGFSNRSKAEQFRLGFDSACHHVLCLINGGAEMPPHEPTSPFQTCDHCGIIEEMPTRLVGDETYTLCEDCFNDQTLTKN